MIARALTAFKVEQLTSRNEAMRRRPKLAAPVAKSDIPGLKDLKPKKNPKGAAIGRIEPRFPPP